MRARTLVWLGLLGGLPAPRAIAAQRLAPLFVRAAAPLPDTAVAGAPVVVVGRTDYHLQGTLIGGLLLGALGTYIGAEACRNQPVPTSGYGSGCTGDALTVGAVGLVIGSGLGYLIGRLTPRGSPTAP